MAACPETTRISMEKRSLKHPFHEHTLTLRELSEECQVECHFCKKRFHGPVYFCEDCDFILHDACAQIEFPPLLHGHPSHRPDHPLHLAIEEYFQYYGCGDDCWFSLDALTAIATRNIPPQEVEEETIWHFSHEEHPLSSFRVDTVLGAWCKLCVRPISGQFYGCRSCLFWLHEACARLTRKVQHPFHKHPISFDSLHSESMYECEVCEKHIETGDAYTCIGPPECCSFACHVGCTALTMPAQNDKKMDQEEEVSFSTIEHHSHRHPLTPFHVRELVYKSSPIWCAVCWLYISGGEAFGCIGCRFFIHKACAEELPREIQQHFLHPQHHRLVFRLEDRRNTMCYSCLKDYSGIAFSCEDCGFNLHLACALQTLSVFEDGAVASVSHFAHEHPLMLAYGESRSEKYTCIACKQYIRGVAYSCTLCSFWLHRSCVELPLELEHTFHPQHPLVLSKAPARYFFCNACHEKHQCFTYYNDDDFDGFAFYCAECEFYMDIRCAFLNQTLKHPRHEHPLAYCERNTTKQLHCSSCRKRCRYDFYCCMPCRFSLHRDCLYLPPTIDLKSRHWDPLQLYDKFVEGNPDAQYCDYCETIRDPEHGVYRCEKCSFSAHIECIISDDKEGAETSIASGTDPLNQLNIQIGSLEAKIEIMRRDLEAMGANLEASKEVLAETLATEHGE